MSMVDTASIFVHVCGMTTQPARPEKSVPRLRRDATRAKILAGAKEVFFTSGFAAAMMEEIAEAAGTRRSTVYLHFREKEDILSAIAQEYTDKIGSVVEQLPAHPTRAQMRDWVDALAHFVSQERAPTELLVALSHLPEVPPSARRFGDAFIAMLGARLPAFAQAVATGGMASAWAVAALENLCWALCHYAREGQTQTSQDRFSVSAELLSRVVEGTI